jgi:hypothetical protein
MGWTFCENWTHESLKAELDVLADGCTLVDGALCVHPATGWGTYWQVIRDQQGAVLVVCNMIEKDRGWLGVKSIAETMGPCRYSCPLHLLAHLTAPLTPWSAEWREKVRAHHADTAAIPA